MTDPNRRDVLGHVTALATAGAFASSAQGQAQAPRLQDSVKALVFDVFGTVVDWRNGVAREAEAILKPLGYSLDWLAFADAWRAQYQPGMDEVRTGKIPFVKLDVIHRRMLQRIVPQFGLEKADAKVLDELTLAWHRLDAWKDVGPGFARPAHAPSLSARSTKSFAATSTGPLGALSPVPGPFSPGRPTCAVRSPAAAAAARSALCAAVIMHSSGLMLSASAVAR